MRLFSTPFWCVRWPGWGPRLAALLWAGWAPPGPIEQATSPSLKPAGKVAAFAKWRPEMGRETFFPHSMKLTL